MDLLWFDEVMGILPRLIKKGTSSAIYSVICGGFVRLLMMARPPLSVDWQAIRGLYLQGIQPKEIAAQFRINESTLRSRASKEKWTHIIATAKERKAAITEKSADIASDLWTRRREAIRENIHTIGSRMTAYASQLPEDQLLAKADKVKIATEIAGKIVGLDRQEDKNVVNIALLGSYTDSASTLQSIQVDTIEGDYSVGHTDSEPL
jgi:hypothetical protein